jgi:hypothetical protein
MSTRPSRRARAASSRSARSGAGVVPANGPLVTYNEFSWSRRERGDYPEGPDRKPPLSKLQKKRAHRRKNAARSATIVVRYLVSAFL